ncbi:MAG: hypothetical protein NTV94_02810 [Planctomycetota bacterium]|nr:hypothetical protein [Planctomycetota bacterium]
MLSTPRKSTIAGLLISLASSCAMAQDDQAKPQSAPSAPWEIELHAGVWYAGLAGDLKLPRQGGGANPVTAQSLDLNSPRITPFGEVNLTKGNWLIEVRGFGFSADATSSPTSGGPLGDVNIGGGARVDTSVEVNSFELEGGYRLLSYEGGHTDSGGTKLRVGLTALLGARLLDTSTSVSLPDGGTGVLRDSDDDLAIHPLAGFKLKADFFEDFTVHFEMSAGWLPGSTESTGLDIIVGGQWRPVQHVGVQIGYRAMFFELISGEDGNEYAFESASLQGLYGGITLSF